MLSSHPGPTVAVTVLTALLAFDAGLGAVRTALVTSAVLAGQLSIGWSNDLLDRDRDHQVGREDKPIARGLVGVNTVRRATLLALVACALLSFACGWRSAAVHLMLGVASGWAHNLGVKGTRFSPVPYAVAFGSLPAVVWLARADPALPPWWMLLAGSLLGVGAHLLNALPDLAADTATNVSGLPQRLGARRVQRLAPVALLAGSVVVAVAPGSRPLGWVALAVASVLAAVAGHLGVAPRRDVMPSKAPGRLPFMAAIGIAVVDVVALLLS